MIKLRLITVLCCLATFSQLALAMSIRNTSLEFANQGMCSAAFIIDSEQQEMTDVEIYYEALNEKFDLVEDGVFKIEHLGYSSSSRFENIYLENEELCDESLALKITRASATIEGKKIDLINNDDFYEKKFEPMKIIMPKH